MNDLKVELKCEKGKLKLKFVPESDDINHYSESTPTLARTECEIQLPVDWSIDKIHPDALGLAIVLIIHPFVKHKLELPFSVSREFAEVYQTKTKKELTPWSDNISPRIPPKDSHPALAYSGGVDSTAALCLLPERTKLFFLERIIPKDQPKRSLYNKEAALFACNELKNLGRDIYIIKSDLEYVRKPVGFPVDVSNSIPALLLVDYCGLDSIAFGTIMESAYRIGHKKFGDYTTSHHYLLWGSLFKLVNMPFNQVVAGISEVGTSKIVMNSPYKYLAQSCMRGKKGKPCMNCWKCFRKILLDTTLKGSIINNEQLEKMFAISEARRKLTEYPIKHENVIAYISSHYKGDNELMLALKKKTRGDSLKLDILEKWYSPSIELIPDKYRKLVSNNISKYLETMNDQEEKILENWIVEDSEESRYYHNLFVRLLDQTKTSELEVESKLDDSVLIRDVILNIEKMQNEINRLTHDISFLKDQLNNKKSITSIIKSIIKR